jgi:hypothetical protein
MPEIKIQHNLNSADKPPARVAIPPGTYDALIVQVTVGLTRQTPSLGKFTLEYRILKDADGKTEQAGRRVYQDYVYEQSGNPEQDGREAYRIRQLLDASGVTYQESGGAFAFNSDHLQNKSVKIAVSQKPGTKPGPDGTLPVYNRVDRVDTAEALREEDVV